MLVEYKPLGRLDAVRADLAALPAGQVVAIGRRWRSDLWALPATLTRLTALTRLHMSGQNQLNDSRLLGQILQPLALLRELGLSDSELAAIPAALSCCTQLTRLDLDYNELADGWQHLQPLTQLQHLVLTGAHDLAAGSHHLAALRLLRWLDLSQCGLAEVPAALSALMALQHLDLSGNRFEGGFDHLRPFGQLQHLEMGGSHLAEVPAAVAALTALTQLSLGRRIRGGWHHLRPLAQLRCFDVVGHVHSTPEALAALAAVGSMHPTAVECMLADSATANLHPLLHLLNSVGFPEHLTLPL